MPNSEPSRPTSTPEPPGQYTPPPVTFWATGRGNTTTATIPLMKFSHPETVLIPKTVYVPGTVIVSP